MNSLLKSSTFRVGVIVLVTLVVYIPAMRSGFVWDDKVFLTENPRIRADDGLYRFWFTTEPPDYFPLVSTGLWLEWRLWGMNPTGYHVVNIVLHALSSVLIWLVLRRLKVPGAWLAAVVFAVHPVNVQSVAWITERKNTQPLLFYLAAILFYLKFEKRGLRRWYFFSLCSFLLALLSKTSVVMLPFVLLGCAWWQRDTIVRKDSVRVIPFFMLSAVLGLVTLWFQYNVAIAEEVVRTGGFLSRLAGAGWAVWFYLFKAVFPVRLNLIYPRWTIDAYSTVSYIPGLVFVACLAMLWRYRKTWGKGPLFGLGYFVVTLFPVLGFFNIYFMKFSFVADHWQYTAIPGVIALVVGIGNHPWNRSPGALRRSLVVAAVVLVGLLSVLTWRRACVYKDEVTLWNDTISRNPSAWVAHNNLGIALFQRGEIDEAIGHYSMALRIKPDYAEAHTNIGAALYRQGKLDEAMNHYMKSLQLTPENPKTHYNMGLVYMKQGNPDEAISHYSMALKAKPDYAMAHLKLGVAFHQQGKVDEAVNHYREVLQIEPNSAVTHRNLGLAYMKQEKLDEAIHHFSEALRIQPSYTKARRNLEQALRLSAKSGVKR